MTGHLFISNRIALEVEPPEWIDLCPWGEVKSKSGFFIMDEAAATATIAAWQQHGIDLVIDYEHQTMGGEFASPTGKAPAAAWIKELKAVPGVALRARVEWTEEGADDIRAKRYRYLSPVVGVRKTDDRVVRLHSVGLTNTPAIVGMNPVVNKERVMVNAEEFERAKWYLNLPATVTEEQIIMEFEKYIGQLREQLKLDDKADGAAVMAAFKERLALVTSICKAVGVAETSSESEIVTAINKAREPKVTDGTDWKARADLLSGQLESANGRIKALEDASTNSIIDTRINSAREAGKVTDAELADEKKGPEIRRMAADEKLWDTFVGCLPTKVPLPGRVITNSQGGGSPSGSGDRASVINQARREFDSDPDLATITNKAAFVADALRQAKLNPVLSDDEKKLVA